MKLAVVLVVVLVVVLLMQQQSGAAARRPPDQLQWLRDQNAAYADAALHSTSSGGGGSATPVADACKTGFSYNDPSRYVGHQDQRVAAVSTANSALSTINCGAVGLAEKGWAEVKSWF